MATYWKIAGASEPTTVTWTLPAPEPEAAVVQELGGVLTSSPFNVHSIVCRSATINMQTGQLAPTAVNTWPLVAFGINPANLIPESTAPSGWLEDYTTENPNASEEGQHFNSLLANLNNVQGSVTWNNAYPGAAELLIMNPAAGTLQIPAHVRESSSDDNSLGGLNVSAAGVRQYTTIAQNSKPNGNQRNLTDCHPTGYDPKNPPCLTSQYIDTNDAHDTGWDPRAPVGSQDCGCAATQPFWDFFYGSTTAVCSRSALTTAVYRNGNANDSLTSYHEAIADGGQNPGVVATRLIAGSQANNTCAAQFGGTGVDILDTFDLAFWESYMRGDQSVQFHGGSNAAIDSSDLYLMDSSAPNLSCAAGVTTTLENPSGSFGGAGYADDRNAFYAGLTHQDGVTPMLLIVNNTCGIGGYNVVPNETYQIGGGSATAANNVIGSLCELCWQNGQSFAPGHEMNPSQYIFQINSASQVEYGVGAQFSDEFSENAFCITVVANKCTATNNTIPNASTAAWYTDRMTYYAGSMMFFEFPLTDVGDKAATPDAFKTDSWGEEDVVPYGTPTETMQAYNQPGTQGVTGGGCLSGGRDDTLVAHGYQDVKVQGSCGAVNGGGKPGGVAARGWSDCGLVSVDMGKCIFLLNPRTSDWTVPCSITVGIGSSAVTIDMTVYHFQAAVTGGPHVIGTGSPYTYPPAGFIWHNAPFACGLGGSVVPAGTGIMADT
jgi:hypothetical protein